jgi:outer membrane lipoprotein SlyB
VQMRNLLVVWATVVVCAACVSSPSSQTYQRREAQSAFNVSYGEVVSTRVVKIEGEASFIGVFGGAEIGRAVGHAVDNGGSHGIAGAVGSVGGAVAGQAVERKLTEEEGLEITVRLDSSDVIAVVQARDVEFSAGERVRVLRGHNGSARVSRL